MEERSANKTALTGDWLWSLVLVVLVVATYQPVWHAGFIWDDDFHVTANPCIVGPLGLREIWTTSAGRLFPLTFTTFWFEHALWGLAPVPYHLVNVAQHAACAVALWQVLRAMRVPGAWLGAALWALHPVQVDSVAWISELKNTQSTLFYLLTILFFARWLKTGEGPALDRRNYVLTLLCAVLALLSKTSTLVLPAVLLLCAWWMEKKGDWRRWLRVLLPLVLLGIAAGLWTVWPRAEETAALSAPQFVRSWPQRWAGAGDAVWFYLGKLLWPHPLMAIYPRWQIDAGQPTEYLPLVGAVVVTVILWFKRRSKLRPVFAAWIYFLITLAPFLGLLEQSFWRYSLVEDHLQYLAAMGPLALAGAGLAKVTDFLPSQRRGLAPALAAGLLATLALLSCARAGVYESEETLWTDNLKKNPQCWLGYYNLGVFLVHQGQPGRAAVDLQKALDLNPDLPEAQNNLGGALVQMGDLDEAIVHYQQALALVPDDVGAHYNLGGVYYQKGRVDEAIAEFQKALALNPHFAEARDNLGAALLKQGRLDEAIAEDQKGLELDPHFPEAHNNLGKALMQKGRGDEAVDQYLQALALNPNFTEAHYNLGNAWLQKRQFAEAIAQYQQALALDPNSAKAHNNLGIALSQSGQLDAGMAEFKEAVRLKPDYADAQQNLARAQAAAGKVRPSP